MTWRHMRVHEKAAAIDEILKANPAAKNKDIAEELGTSAGAVDNFRHRERHIRNGNWDFKRGQKKATAKQVELVEAVENGETKPKIELPPVGWEPGE